LQSQRAATDARAKMIYTSSTSKMSEPLLRIELAKIMNTTLKNCPKIMMIPVEKLSLNG